MPYDLEKYRSKREKVLGVRKRGLSFGSIAVLVSLCILLGLGAVVVPKTASFIATRNLDDAIYRLENAKPWPKEILPEVLGIQGVENASTDMHGTRLVVTFDRTTTDTASFTAFFKRKELDSTLLNRVSHRQRVSTLKEEEEFEAL